MRELVTRNSIRNIQGVPKKNVPRLCDCCGGAIDTIISVFIQLHRSGFNLEFETLRESI